MLRIDPEKAAHALATWFAGLRELLDRTVFAVGADDRHRRAAAITVVTRHVASLERCSGQPVEEVREAVWVLVAATRALGIPPLGRSEWLAAARNVASLDQQLSAMPEGNAWLTGDAAAIFRQHMLESLRHAGVARVPTILDADNRRVALALAVNWGMRYVVSVAAGLIGQDVPDAAAREVVAAVRGGS